MMKRKGRKITTGRFDSRDELVEFIFNRYHNTGQNITQIAKAARISSSLAGKILDGKA